MCRDYTDSELSFPRLEVGLSHTNGYFGFVTIWLREKPGNDRRLLIDERTHRSVKDAHQLILKHSKIFGAAVDEDDIAVT